MLSRKTALILLAATSAFGGDWNKRLAADYLDARQKAAATGPSC
jgi:hypothetical protein